MVSAKTAHPAEARRSGQASSSPMRWRPSSPSSLAPSPPMPTLIDQVEGTEQYKWIVSDIAAATGSVMVLDVLLEASVSNAYLDAGVEILNGTKTPAAGDGLHPRRRSRGQGEDVDRSPPGRITVRAAHSPCAARTALATGPR